MAAPLFACTKEEQRSVIRFFISEGVKPTEIHRRMKVQYGDACLSQQKVYEWSRKFRNGVTSVADAPRPGQAHRVVTPESIAPYLDPSDYHMFGPPKEAMGGKKFRSDEEVQTFVGSLGGALSLYLGITLLMLVEVMDALFRLFYNCCLHCYRTMCTTSQLSKPNVSKFHYRKRKTAIKIDSKLPQSVFFTGRFTPPHQPIIRSKYVW
ncbi:uncharacterized protein LOC110838493 [Zootermopsis nevadensis]|uniref:uncharacterized protein LOC110838493 n=1 Tax=Zootermopsis nevadensis TaxID=136037 RepID=UPI000B8E7221|nr:uncharacterized protein LOC110838493 [Zootermopsis nevadensis]